MCLLSGLVSLVLGSFNVRSLSRAANLGVEIPLVGGQVIISVTIDGGRIAGPVRSGTENELISKGDIEFVEIW